jgi:hypothetical protein
MAGWADLARELDTWHDERRTATFWWRDDDATRATPELDRLLAISGDTDTPVALAVIPRDVDGGLRDRLREHARASVLQHGWSHENHAPDGSRQEEHGPHRPLAVMLNELAEGWQRVGAFERGLPVLVAPWNRIDASLFPALPGIGLGAVSTLGPRDAAEPVSGVRRTNVHVDIVDWDGSRGFMGEDAALDQFVRHLAARRRGEVDADEPTGLMTHHLYHDEGCWWFVGEVLRRTRSHPAVRWLDGREAFWP